MRAVDTNVILRVLTRDDPAQVLAADAVMRGPVHVPVSVMIEAERILRRGYRWSRPAIGDALRTVYELRTATVQHADAVAFALDRHAEGADFADAMHVALARGADDFATFDRDLGRRLGTASPLPITVLA